MIPRFVQPSGKTLIKFLSVAWLVLGGAAPVSAQITAFKQAVAEAASENEGVSAFYRDSGYEAIWTGKDAESMERRSALFNALSLADLHGLPQDRYKVEALKAQMADVRSVRDLGQVEAALSQIFVKYARDLQSGFIKPSTIDKDIVRKITRPESNVLLSEFANAKPSAYLRELAPASSQYRALLKEKISLEQLLAAGGWGPSVPVRKMKSGDAGRDVIALRNRLIEMGYLNRTATSHYDSSMQKAVEAFQRSHGLEVDGVAGTGTIKEINKSVADRLKSVIVALERERWLPRERGKRHILVNQTDFSAQIVDEGYVTFQTRSVIGKNMEGRRTPEFSDEMEHMVINPSWYVPRSIITKEYLPKLRANPNAVSHIEITDSRGRRVNRGAVNFSNYSAKTFPFSMRQPPSKRNALGLVKFIFPNKHNIYLHDTPQKHLFAREVRAYSHGCIRLSQPFEFAYALLAHQEENPKDYFHSVLNTGTETKVPLKQKLPVHIIYRTAVVTNTGKAEFRKDIYGRDAKIWDAMRRAGVALSAVQG